MKLCHALVAAAALTAALSVRAQDARDPLALIPKDALVVGWIDGPAKLSDAFGATRLARLWTGPEVAALFGPRIEQLQTALKDMPPDARQLLEAAGKTLQGYAGRVWIAIGLDVAAGMAGDEFDPVAAGLYAVAVMAADGTTDLAELARSIEEAVERHGGEEFRDLDVAGRSYRVAENPAEKIGVTLPFVHDSHLVMLAAADIESALARRLAPEASFADRDTPLPAGSAGAWIDLRSLIGGLQQLLPEDGPPFDPMFDAFGISALETAAVTAAPAGEHVAFGAELRFGREQLGLFGALISEQGPPAVLDFAPVQRGSWSVTALDFAKLYAAIRAGFDSMKDEIGLSWAEIEAQFEEQFRVRLEQDLFAHVDNGLLTVGPAKAEPGEDVPGTKIGIEGACYAVPLKDAKSFEESLEKLLRSRGLHVARKQEEYRGFEVQRVPLAGVLEVHYAISSRLLLMGFGGGGGRELRAVLDEERERSEGTARSPYPDAVAERLDLAFKGWQGIGVSSVVDSIDQFGGAFLEGLNASGESAVRAAIQELLAPMGRIYAQYGLETAVTVTRANRALVEVRMIW